MQKSHMVTVYETRDYGLFKTLAGNRDLNAVQIKKLARVIENAPQFTRLSPLLVNENMEIIDGQHRLAAYKKYAAEKTIVHPIYFTVNSGTGIAEARNLNAGSKPWTPKDYAVAYSNSGNKEYATYLKYSRETGLNHDILVRFLSPKNYDLQTFRSGMFVVENEKKSREWFSNLEEMGMTIKETMAEPIDHKHRSFAIGLLNVMRNPNYHQERMLEQLEAHSRILRVTDMKNQDISLALQTIYNKGQEDRVMLID